MGDDAHLSQEDMKRRAKEAHEQAEEKKEEVKGKASLVVDLAKQSYDFGLYLTFLATWHAALELPWGLARAGAAATRTIVDAGDAKGTTHTFTGILTSIIMTFVPGRLQRAVEVLQC